MLGCGVVRGVVWRPWPRKTYAKSRPGSTKRKECEMRLRGAARQWWDEMFKSKGPRVRYARQYGKNGAQECERRRKQIARACRPSASDAISCRSGEMIIIHRFSAVSSPPGIIGEVVNARATVGWQASRFRVPGWVAPMRCPCASPGAGLDAVRSALPLRLALVGHADGLVGVFLQDRMGASQLLLQVLL